MGLFIGQNDKRSELQSKIIADLQQKVRQTNNEEGDEGNPTAEPESTLLENQHETRTAGVVIGLLVFVMAVVIIFIVARS